ncbi:MAG: tRNA (adenine(22)-N(1))-methyltransferase TrmK [Candidatus Izemoplasmatales bacterium]
MILSKRLEAALSFLGDCVCLMDVGSDHAYVAIEAVERGIAKRAIAIENKQKPFEKSRVNALASSKASQIEVWLSDGLSKVDPQCDAVTILGMGGRLIADILSGGDLRHIQQLILCPNSESEDTRRFLEEHHFEITQEVALIDHDKYYQIIKAVPGEMTLTEMERRFGPIILHEKPEAMVRFIGQRIAVLTQAQQHAKTKEVQTALAEEIALLKECIQ